MSVGSCHCNILSPHFIFLLVTVIIRFFLIGTISVRLLQFLIPFVEGQFLTLSPWHIIFFSLLSFLKFVALRMLQTFVLQLLMSALTATETHLQLCD